MRALVRRFLSSMRQIKVPNRKFLCLQPRRATLAEHELRVLERLSPLRKVLLREFVAV